MSQLSRRLTNLSPPQRRLLQQRIQEKQRDAGVAEPIAIVGMACRFPGAPNVHAYWRLMDHGIRATSEIPPDRWAADEFYDSEPGATGKMAVRWGGFLERVDEFDPQFFGITPREATRMDPQQRLLLEVAWEALEQGGLAPDRLGGSATGVFVGIGGNDYSKIPARTDAYLDYIDPHVGTGNALSIAANRLSYIFDFHGPSMSIDTACSSALVGMHLAVGSLRNGECELALAGGVNLILTPEVTIAFSKARMLSPTGHCRPFDARADGYVRGEGCGMVVLKRLTDAVQSGDNILAVLRGSAVNQDGRTSGITAPNGRLQQAVISAALEQGGVNPRQVSYIEAHGTGTPLGDPIELEALATLFGKVSLSDPPCYMSSVKANIGHLETASAMASVIKVILMMRHGRIPSQLDLEELNPHVSLHGTRLTIPRKPLDWSASEGPRIAGVSSFGFGGTNAHVVLEESSPPEPTVPRTDRPMHLFTLSAKTKTSLDKAVGDYTEKLDNESNLSLADLCHSANTGRSHLEHRMAIVADSREALRKRLGTMGEGKRAKGVESGQIRTGRHPRLAMLFTGQGSQYVNMGRGLFLTQPTFRDALRQCDEILQDELEESLLSVLYPGPGSDSPLNETAYTQPALFALEYSLATLWRSWGVQPDIVLGHSIGEYVAACVAGVFTLEDGLRLIAGRARLMQQLPRNGLMAAVLADASSVRDALGPHQGLVSVAAVNGPSNTVISGKAEVVRVLLEEFQANGVRTQLLAVSHAFHSPLMEPMLDDFAALAAGVTYLHPRIPLVSNLTGKTIVDAPPEADYWRHHVRAPVQFAAGMNELARTEIDAILEVGPAATLLGMGRQCLPKVQVPWLPSLREGRDEWEVLLGSLAQWYALGAKIDWAEFDRHWPRRRVELPTCHFERTRHWFDLKQASQSGVSHAPRSSAHPLLGGRVPSALSTTLFESRFSARSPSCLADHQVQGSPVTPAAAYIEQGLAAAEQTFGPGAHVLKNLSIQQAMLLSEGHERTVQVAISPENRGECNFETYSGPADSDDADLTWTLHASGSLCHAGSQPTEDAPRVIDFDDVRGRAIDVKTREEFYELMASRGLEYGPTFRVLDDLRRAERDACTTVCLSEPLTKEPSRYRLHLALLDGCLQTMAAVVPLEGDGTYSPHTYMPVGIRQVRFHGELTDRMYVYAARTSEDDRPSPEKVEGDVFLLDGGGRVLVELTGVRLQRLVRSLASERQSDVCDWLYHVNWQPLPLPDHSSSVGGLRGRTTDGLWLILSDRRRVGRALAEQLAQRGEDSILVAPEGGFSAHSAESSGKSGDYGIDALSGEDYDRLLEELFGRNRSSCLGVIHLWSLDIANPEHPDFEPAEAARRLGCGSVLQLVREMSRFGFAKPPALWLVTCGAQAVSVDEEDRPVVSLAQTPLWGMGRVAALEHPEFRCRLIDLDPAEEASESALFLARELRADSGEPQVAFRSGRRHIARLEVAPPTISVGDGPADGRQVVPPGNAPFRVQLGVPGSLDSLGFESFSHHLPGPGQVELEVEVTGLNFSDVLKAMGLYPGITDNVVPLGIECSGVVTRVAEDVERFKAGDRVMGVAPYSFATHAVTAEYALVHKPDLLTHAEAATVPITFLTAYYALRQLGDLQRGERVLIHAGAGGVGQAAIQIARQIGAEIFTTAGSETKREFLRSLGVEHVFDSRTLDFGRQIMEVTNREGVDVVLNSLPGDAITASLSLLSAYGRFLEIGKIDIYQNRMIGLLPFQDNLSYHAIDLDRMLRQRPRHVREMFAEMMQHFHSGDYQPLPLTQFSIEKVTEAFRYMAQRKNIGKVVVSLADRSSDVSAPALPRGSIRAEGTYLITGGLGSLGLKAADWLVSQGARHLALMSRREASGGVAEAINSLRQAGAEVAVVQGDVADPRSLELALDRIPKEFPPLRGVLHAAGVLDDGVLFEMDLDQLDRVIAPKVQGSWNLHQATVDAPLDFFVLFSSVASVLGSPGQGNYAAGNAFLDGLAHYRRFLGLPATSINWGPWADSGMAVQAGLSKQMESRGMALIPPEDGFRVLAGLLRSDATDVTVIDVDWGNLLQSMAGRELPLLRDVAGDQDQPADAAENKIDHAWLKELVAADRETRIAILRRQVSEELTRIAGIEPGGFDLEQPLNTVGLDSLMAMELVNVLEARLDITIPVAILLEGPSVASLAEHAANLLFPDTSPRAGVSDADERRPKAVQRLLVQLRSGGQRPPLFCVHALDGDPRCYLELAGEIGEEWPVYAIRSRGSHLSHEPHHSMEEMVAEYLEAIRAVQPAGPYYLAGWSAGGIFAHEITGRLLDQGDQVGLLAFLDTPLPSIYDKVNLNDDAKFLCDFVDFANRFLDAQMDISYEQLREHDSETAFQIALEEAKKRGVLPADGSADHVRRLVKVAKTNARMIMDCSLSPIPQHVHLVQPVDRRVLARAAGEDLGADLGWRSVLGHRLTSEETPGDHFTMLTGSNAVRLGELLTLRLEEAHTATSSPLGHPAPKRAEAHPGDNA